jgi:hypothetical protein
MRPKRPLSLTQAQIFNAIVWVTQNHIVNENGSPIEFKDHTFLIDPYLDNSERQVIEKASQIGWSTLAILRSFHLAKYARANIIHSFPSRNMSKEFVVPKVDPLIARNPVIKEMIKTDTSSLKEVDGRFIYYRGAWDVTEAISISAHILIQDEYDRSNQRILKTYRSRLDDAKRERPELGWEWQFSNPSIPGYGVDEWWQKSDMKHWFIKCRKCGYDWYMKWPDNINMDTQEKVCAKCYEPFTREDLTNGRWVKKYNDRKISGYWISQLFVPWITAEKIIDDSRGDQEIFHNFTLGLPYVSKDTTVTREAIIKCLSPGFNPRTAVAIGVDNGIEKHYVIGNRHGIFEMGKTRDWEEIERLRNRYGAIMVIDALPYPNTPTQLAEKYPGKVFINFFQADKKNMGVIRWDNRVVKSDRTKIIDAVVAEINSGDVTFNLTQTQMEDYIHHWEQVFRVIEKTPMGTMKPRWQTIEGRADHFVFAHLLQRIALEKTMSFGGIVRSPLPGGEEEGHPIVSEDQRVGALDLKDVLHRSQRKVMR